MQWSNPIQSMRDGPRAALRLQRWIAACEGLAFPIYFKARVIAFCWSFMHRASHRQLSPMLRNAGSRSGTGPSAPARAGNSRTIARPAAEARVLNWLFGVAMLARSWPRDAAFPLAAAPGQGRAKHLTMRRFRRFPARRAIRRVPHDVP
jgi:hypothetical protein